MCDMKGLEPKWCCMAINGSQKQSRGGGGGAAAAPFPAARCAAAAGPAASPAPCPAPRRSAARASEVTRPIRPPPAECLLFFGGPCARVRPSNTSERLSLLGKHLVVHGAAQKGHITNPNLQSLMTCAALQGGKARLSGIRRGMTLNNLFNQSCQEKLKNDPSPPAVLQQLLLFSTQCRTCNHGFSIYAPPFRHHSHEACPK